MALPTLTKTWQFNVNNAQGALGSAGANNKALILAIKNAWLGFGTLPATMFYSCNSVTAGTAGDGVDRITTTANLVGNTAGSAHSWFVLKLPGIGSNFQVLFDFASATASFQFANITYSPSAGFTGGSTTAAPTATDSVSILTTGTAWSGIASDVACRWSVEQSTDGQCNRIFVFAAGTQRVYAMFEKGANPTGGTPGATNSGWVTWTGATNTGLAGQTVQNAITAATVLSYETTPNLSIASEVDGLWDIFPIGQACTVTVGARGRLFTLQDIWATSASLATGDSFPSTGTTGQFIVIAGTSNGIVLPWNTGAFNLS